MRITVYKQANAIKIKFDDKRELDALATILNVIPVADAFDKLAEVSYDELSGPLRRHLEELGAEPSALHDVCFKDIQTFFLKDAIERL